MSIVRKQRLVTAALIVSVTLGTLFLLQLQSGFQQLRSLTTVSLPTPEDISLSSAVLSDYILNFMLRYTEAAVPVSMFLGGLGVPLPNSLLVIILGSLVQQRLLLLASLSWLIILPTILGDICSYLLIRAAWQSQRLQRVLRPAIQFFSQTDQSRAQTFFARYGYLSIFLSRFAVTPLAIPVNIVAASSKYPFHKFFVMAALGETVWASMYAGIGYTFGLYWQTVYQIINSVVGLLSTIAVAMLLLGITTTHRRRKRRARMHPKSATISA